jgi:hypothetical protein
MTSSDEGNACVVLAVDPPAVVHQTHSGEVQVTPSARAVDSVSGTAHVASSGGAENGHSSDVTEGGFFIPVGFTVVHLAICPSGSAFSGTGPLLAAAADNGMKTSTMLK